jgi:hypothetical protein
MFLKILVTGSQINVVVVVVCRSSRLVMWNFDRQLASITGREPDLPVSFFQI